EAAELAALKTHPAVKAILDEFPDAKIAEVRTLLGPAKDDTGTGRRLPQKGRANERSYGRDEAARRDAVPHAADAGGARPDGDRRPGRRRPRPGGGCAA